MGPGKRPPSPRRAFGKRGDPAVGVVLRSTQAGRRVPARSPCRHSTRTHDDLLAAFEALQAATGLDARTLLASLLGVRRNSAVLQACTEMRLDSLLSATAVGARLDELLASHPTQEQRAAAREKRRKSGVYYTPPLLVEQLLDDGLDPLIERCRRSASATDALRALRLLDPACGSGAFLWPAAQRLCAAAQSLGLSVSAGRRLAADGLTGVDLDELALTAARLRFEAAGWPVPRLICADGLGTDVREGAVFGGGSGGEGRGFDLVIGNPPFANAMEQGHLEPQKLGLPELGATADLAHAFFAQALRCRNSEGRVALILPRSTLTAAGARGVRCVAQQAGLLHLRLPQESRLFGGADVHVCLVTVGRAFGEESRGSSVVLGLGTDSEERVCGVVCSERWWEEIQDLRRPRAADDEPVLKLDDCFQVRTSFFVHDFYALRDHIVDTAENVAGDPALITTGLIEPGETLWGKVPCRYAKRDYQRPRIRLADMPESLRRKVSLQLVPKILVAGLARRIEAVLDAEGTCVGALQTFVITPRRGGVRALRALVQWLNGAAASECLRRQLGANALSGGNITLRPDFLRSLPLPAKRFARFAARAREHAGARPAGLQAQASTESATTPCTSVRRKSRPA